MRRVHHYRVPIQKFSVHVRLYIRPHLNRGSLIGIVYHQGQRLKFSLGHHHIRPEHWDSVRQRMMIGSPNSDTINQSIDQWVGKIILYYTTLVSSGQPPSISGLQSHLFPNRRTTTRAKSPDSVVMWFNRFIREHTNKGITQLSLYPSS